MAVTIKLSNITKTKNTELTQIHNMEIQKQYSVPADSATFVIEGIVQNQSYRNIEVIYEFKTIFAGVIDSFETTVSDKGIFTTIKCRNYLALLIDREAKPLVFNSVSYIQLHALYVDPHPLAYQFTSTPTVTNFTVRKSMSCWAVIELYCIQALGIRPRLVNNATITTNYFLRPFYFTVNETQSSELPFTYASFKEDTSDVITRVFVKNDIGYSNSVANAYYGDDLLKERYLDPGGQWVGKSTLEARTMVEESMVMDKVLTLKIPQITQIEIGSVIEFSYKDIYTLKSYQVMEIKETLNGNTVETQVRANLIK